MVFFQHLHIGILRKAILTDGREVCRFPAGTVEIMFDLGRHGDVVG
jgi:hypothetical protein